MKSLTSDEKTLEKHLFNPEMPKYGARTRLDVNYLPSFVDHLKKNMDQGEISSIQDFEVFNRLPAPNLSTGTLALRSQVQESRRVHQPDPRRPQSQQ